MSFVVPEEYRLKKYSAADDGNNGIFYLPSRKLKVIASDGLGWEHVSVSREDRCPTWAEMNFVKNLFWDDEDCVVQYHPPRSEYVNNHPFCLHLWRPTTAGVPMPLPPSYMVGVK